MGENEMVRASSELLRASVEMRRVSVENPTASFWEMAEAGRNLAAAGDNYLVSMRNFNDSFEKVEKRTVEEIKRKTLGGLVFIGVFYACSRVLFP